MDRTEAEAFAAKVLGDASGMFAALLASIVTLRFRRP